MRAILAWLLPLSFAYWDFHGALPEWRPSFPDYDCRLLSRVPSAHRGWEDVDWRDFRLEAEELGVGLARAGDVPFQEARLESMSMAAVACT